MTRSDQENGGDGVYVCTNCGESYVGWAGDDGDPVSLEVSACSRCGSTRFGSTKPRSN